MARLHRLYLSDDPATALNYEVWFRIVGATNWTQLFFNHPLPTMEVLSPPMEAPFIALGPLADATEYEYQYRMFNQDNQPGNWETGTFTTGS